MKSYLLKLIIFFLALFIFFELTIGKRLDRLDNVFNSINDTGQRVEFKEKIKKELKKGIIALSEREGVRLYRWALTFTRSQPDLNCNIQFAF